ncbi:MAG: hypothetical protein CYPHOPRED_001162 [Cyphobasidiales sp. Tagirdzhanova-0007]|nr:MAG: hypothetical protein CYPHOPRED_001162 [Cyphobasidiales sp. Tagirdzhanova-0007]
MVKEMQVHGVAAFVVKESAEAEYKQWLYAKLNKTVWQGGCLSYYRQDNGKITVMWPGTFMYFWWRTRRPNFSQQPLPADRRHSNNGGGGKKQAASDAGIFYLVYRPVAVLRVRDGAAAARSPSGDLLQQYSAVLGISYPTPSPVQPWPPAHCCPGLDHSSPPRSSSSTFVPCSRRVFHSLLSSAFLLPPFPPPILHQSASPRSQSSLIHPRSLTWESQPLSPRIGPPSDSHQHGLLASPPSVGRRCSLYPAYRISSQAAAPNPHSSQHTPLHPSHETRTILQLPRLFASIACRFGVFVVYGGQRFRFVSQLMTSNASFASYKSSPSYHDTVQIQYPTQIYTYL